MTDHAYTGTIDWDRYWEDANDDVRAATSPSADLARDPLLALLQERYSDGPDAYADVGCGPGDLAFAVADHYPETTVVGYDAADPVLAENRRRAAERGADVQFERAVLPAFDPDRQFEVVSCLFTLCYVADAARAVRNLYDAVAPGGDLIIHYHNRLAAAHYHDIAAAPHDYLDDESAWNPETFAERFELVVDGENLLSYERLHNLLGTWPRSVFSVADGAEAYGAHRYEPLVFVPK